MARRATCGDTSEPAINFERVYSVKNSNCGSSGVFVPFFRRGPPEDRSITASAYGHSTSHHKPPNETVHLGRLLQNTYLGMLHRPVGELDDNVCSMKMILIKLSLQWKAKNQLLSSAGVRLLGSPLSTPWNFLRTNAPSTRRVIYFKHHKHITRNLQES